MNENKEKIISGSAISRLVLAHKYKRKEIFNYEECSFILNKLIENDKEIDRLNDIIDEIHLLFIEFDRNVMKRKYVEANMINLKIKAKLKELKEGK